MAATLAYDPKANLSPLFNVCGRTECLSEADASVSSPRLSPDGTTLVYLQGRVFGPHNQCVSLHQVLCVRVCVCVCVFLIHVSFFTILIIPQFLPQNCIA